MRNSVTQLTERVSCLRLATPSARRAGRLASALAFLFAAIFVPPQVEGQTIYHLHGENSTTSGARQLKVAGPDVATVTLQSSDYKNRTPTSEPL